MCTADEAAMNSKIRVSVQPCDWSFKYGPIASATVKELKELQQRSKQANRAGNYERASALEMVVSSRTIELEILLRLHGSLGKGFAIVEKASDRAKSFAEQFTLLQRDSFRRDWTTRDRLTSPKGWSAARRVGHQVAKELGFDPKEDVGAYVAHQVACHLYGMAHEKRGTALKNTVGLAALVSGSDFQLALSLGKSFDSATENLFAQKHGTSFRVVSVLAGPMNPLLALLPGSNRSHKMNTTRKLTSDHSSLISSVARGVESRSR